MKAYIYAADIYCEECALEIRDDIRRKIAERVEVAVNAAIETLEKTLKISLDDSPKACLRILQLAIDAETPDEDSDSGEWPQGPYSDGGGEADCPQHCGACHEFLENPLTSVGMAYVRENQNDQWDSFYDINREEDDDND